MSDSDLVTNFLNLYYQTFMNNRSQLMNFYRDTSMLSYEGANCRGLAEIGEKLAGLSFQTIEFKFENHDFQPTPANGGIMIVVCGTLLMDKENMFNFFQVFHLHRDGGGNPYISNEVFRLVINQ